MSTSPPAADCLTLDALPLRQPMRVTQVRAPSDQPDWQRWLEEIGFVPGEVVSLVARSALGGDPLVVKVGSSRFALRQAEAACVRVEAIA